MKESLVLSGENDEQERPVLGVTADGATVRDRIDSHFHAESGLTKELLATAISTIDTKGNTHVVEQVDFDRQVGTQTCVEVGPDDDIEMVFRKFRSGRTPMVHGREPQPTNSVVVVLAKDRNMEGDGNYVLLTSYAGERAPREPWDPCISNGEDVMEAEDFWSKHALLYDESLIDMERTKAFNNASEEERNLEIMRENVLYTGLFIDPNDLYSKAPATLDKRIATPHVTTAFRPGVEQLNLDSLGSGARIIAVGYGNDGRNEGLLVQIEAEDPAIQAACDALEVPHITLSVAEGAAAKDTANLEFAPLKEPFELSGQYGLFEHGKVKYKQ